MSAYIRDLCKSDTCRKPIIWTVTEKGHQAPIDFDPSPDGNVELVPLHGQVPLSRIVSKAERNGRDDLRTNHFTHCPDSPYWRKRNPKR